MLNSLTQFNINQGREGERVKEIEGCKVLIDIESFSFFICCGNLLTDPFFVYNFLENTYTI